MLNKDLMIRCRNVKPKNETEACLAALHLYLRNFKLITFLNTPKESLNPKRYKNKKSPIPGALSYPNNP
jgi:hypothetical protein